MTKTLLTILLLAGFTFANAQTNLILNGDMEQWNSWTGELGSWSRFFNGDIEKSNDAQSGSASTQLTTSSFSNGVNFITSNDIDFEAGKVYKGSFYYKVLSGQLARFEYSIEGFLTTDFTGSVMDLSIGGWKKVDFDYTPTTSAKFGLKIYLKADADSKVLIDNVSMALAASTSVGSESADQALAIYPNPTTDYLQITNVGNISSVTINAVNGDCSKLVQLGADGRINVSDLPAGMYVLHAVSEGKMFSSKFIKK